MYVSNMNAELSKGTYNHLQKTTELKYEMSQALYTLKRKGQLVQFTWLRIKPKNTVSPRIKGPF